MKSFSHLDATGQATMVDVGSKSVQTRTARAEGRIHCAESTIALLREKALPKGDVLAVARIAGIQAAKKTADLIPLCHTLPLDQVTVDFEIESSAVTIKAFVRTSSKTGVEMEALVAVSVAGLTLYDMMKAVDKSMEITAVRVTEKVKE